MHKYSTGYKAEDILHTAEHMRQATKFEAYVTANGLLEC